jgi:hypothetical protein
MATTRAVDLESFNAFVGHFRRACDLIALQFFSNETLLQQKEFFLNNQKSSWWNLQYVDAVFAERTVRCTKGVQCLFEYYTVHSTN